MRNELQHIEQIEKYLNGEMTSTEISIFEESMKNNLALHEQVQTQQLVMQAAVRKALKADIAKYGAGVSGGFNWTKWSGISVGIIVIALISYFTIFSDGSTPAVEKESVNNSKESPKSPEIVEISSPIDSTEVTNSIDSVTNMETGQANESSTNHHKKYDYPEDTQCGGLKTWVEPDKQITKIDPKKGATIEGKDGTLIIVPTDAFIDDEGNLITKEVTLELVEALKVSDMLAYNLTTMNDENVLQSGGMIYLQPTVGDKKVSINPDRPLYIEIPTDEYNPEMKAWEGMINDNGDINWQNPKELQKYLTIVDFELLDFLPNGFEEAVAAGMPFKSYQNADNELVDSLYYSLGIQNENIVVEKSDSLMDYAEFESIISRAGLAGKDGSNSSGGKFAFKEWFDFMFGKKYLRGKSTLFGHIEDAYGNRISNANIYIVQNGFTNKKDIIADEKGYFVFNKLESGPFNVMVIAPGYDPLYSDQFTSNEKEEFIIESALILKPSSNNFNFAKGQFTPIEASLYNATLNSNSEETSCFIAPQSIQAIKQKEFSKTFLSTKEFEQRIKILHQMPNAQELFDLYVNNLSKNLWEVDKMVANKLNGADKKYFTDFAAEQLTNVKDLNIYQDQLSAYYNKKKKEYIASAKKANEVYQDQSTKELNKYLIQLNQLKADYNNLSEQQLTGNLASINNSFPPKSKAPRLTLPNVALKQPKTNVVTSNNSYAVSWYSGGWMNIDAYLHELSKGSKTVDIEVKEGKGKIYQCLNTLKTIVPLTIAGIIAKAKFPKWGNPGATKMSNTFAIGIQRDNDYLQYAEQYYNPYQTSKISLNWTTITPKELKTKLAKLDGTGPLLNEIKQQEAFIQKQLEIKKKQEELKQQKQKIEEEMNAVQENIDEIQTALAKERAFIASLEEVVNKCGVAFPIKAKIVQPINDDGESMTAYDEIKPVLQNSDGIYEIAEEMPEFPGGQEAMYAFISQNIIYPNMSIQGKVYVQFIVDELGQITNPLVIKSVQPDLDAEALRVVSLMPDWTPGMNQGKAVKVRYTLPINFILD